MAGRNDNNKKHNAIIEQLRKAWTLPKELTEEYAREHYPTYYATFGKPDPKRWIQKDDKSKTVWQSIYDFDPTGMYVSSSFEEASRIATMKGRTPAMICVYKRSIHSPSESRNFIIVTGVIPIRGIRRDEVDPRTPEKGFKDSFSLSASVHRHDGEGTEDEWLLRDKFRMYDDHMMAHLKVVNEPDITSAEIEVNFSRLLRKPKNNGELYWLNFKIDQVRDSETTNAKEFNELALFKYHGDSDDWSDRVSKPTYIFKSARPSSQDADKWSLTYDPRVQKPAGQWETNDTLIGKYAQGSIQFSLSRIGSVAKGFYPIKTAIRVSFHSQDVTRPINYAGLDDDEDSAVGSTNQPPLTVETVSVHTDVFAPKPEVTPARAPEPEVTKVSPSPPPQPQPQPQPEQEQQQAQEQEQEQEKKKAAVPPPPAKRKSESAAVPPALAPPAKKTKPATTTAAGPPKLNLNNLVAAMPKKA